MLSKGILSRRSVFAGLVLAGLAACQTTANEAADRLTADQVRATFVDHEWGQGQGTFMFAKDGTYRYADNQSKVHGTYQVADDGVLCATNASDSTRAGVKTCFTFYRDGSGYRYFHDRSGKYWPAYLR